MTVIKQDHAVHMEQLKLAVMDVLPVLCYTQEGIDEFLKGCEKPYNYRFFRVETDTGASLVSINPGGRSSTSWGLNHIVPTKWEGCHHTVGATIKKIKEDAEREGMATVSLSVNEGIPSHNGYFGGLLPMLGFSMLARITLTAPLAKMDSLEPPALPMGIKEFELREDRLEEAIDAYVEAFAEQHGEISDEGRKRRRISAQEYLQARFQNKNYAPTWVALECKGRVVALCFGCEDTWTQTLDLVEVAVIPEFRRLRLGQYICIRCMQKTRAAFTSPDRQYLVSADRTNIAAIRLYERLGFIASTVYSFATCPLATTKPE